MLSKGFVLAILSYLLVCCGRPSAQEEQLARFARLKSTQGENYLTHYARALRLKAATEHQARQREFFVSAYRDAAAAPECADLACAEAALRALGASERSGLFAYAVYHLAEAAMRDNQFAEALLILKLAGEAPAALERKISLLKGRLLQFTVPAGSEEAAQRAEHFRAHASKFKDGESLYLVAEGLDRSGDKQGALAHAILGLEHPEVDFSFSQSGILVRNLLGQRIYSLTPELTRVRLMEALRVAKDRASAQKLYQTLVHARISGDDRRLFVQYASRLLIDKGDFRSLGATLTGGGKDFFEDSNEKAALDVCERLLKKKQYPVIRQFFQSAGSGKAKLQCQLRLAQRTSDYSVAVRRVAAEYITAFDFESTLAERIFLRSCLPDKIAKRRDTDIACLEELRQITASKPIGAGARYFLARHFDAAGDAASVRLLLSEIANDYADDYYFYRLIDKPLVMQAQLAASATSGSDRAARLTDALFSADISRAHGMPELPVLTDFAKQTAKKLKDPDDALATAALLFAADSRDEARELLRNPEKLQVYQNLVVLGQISGKSDIALFGVKQWLREQKLRPFLYEIPPRLRQILYPTSYSAHVEKYAAKHRIEVSEVMALIRQESQFYAGAISRANALGLMQLLPSTAKLVAVKEGVSRYNLLQAEDNIRLGIAFMRDIKDHYAADFVGLAIAYNAGPGRYTQWKKKLSSDEALFVEEIPFQETYHYVRVLLSDRAKYRALLKHP